MTKAQHQTRFSDKSQAARRSLFGPRYSRVLQVAWKHRGLVCTVRKSWLMLYQNCRVAHRSSIDCQCSAPVIAFRGTANARDGQTHKHVYDRIRPQCLFLCCLDRSWKKHSVWCRSWRIGRYKIQAWRPPYAAHQHISTKLPASFFIFCDLT